MLNLIEQLRERAANLLSLALEARGNGHGERAESLTKMAAHSLDQATSLEHVARSHSAQLQQQRRPKAVKE